MSNNPLTSLPGDNITQLEAEELAAKYECPSSNVCRICGAEIVMMAWTMTGSCCGDHEKLRWQGDKPRA